MIGLWFHEPVFIVSTAIYHSFLFLDLTYSLLSSAADTSFVRAARHLPLTSSCASRGELPQVTMSSSAISLYMKFESGLMEGVSPYLIARRPFKSPEEWQAMIAQLSTSTTVYIGNLSFFTSEVQLTEFFSRVGSVKRVIMGLNRITKEPCGFCFVEYDTHEGAVAARVCLNGAKLDGRNIRVDIDPGFEPGREFGKGKTGGQIRDEHRETFDLGRGGWGGKAQDMAQLYNVAGLGIGAMPTATGGVADAAAAGGASAATAMGAAGANEPPRPAARKRAHSPSRSRSPASDSRSRSRSPRRSRSRSRSSSRSRSWSRSRSRSRSPSRSRTPSRSRSPSRDRMDDA